MKFIITGHAKFSLGIESAIAMIAGSVANLVVVPFLEEMSLIEYQKKLDSEIAEEEIVCFTDLLGGTPYKTCVELSTTRKGMKVLSGTNLAMVLEGLYMRENISDLSELCQLLIQSGKDNIALYAEEANVEEDLEEGI